MKYLSLFSGIGGFELGIQQAYESLCNADGSKVGGIQEDTEGNKGQRLLTEEGQNISTEERPTCECPTDITYERPLCIGYSEIDKYAIQTYQLHFPEHNNYGDITKINADELPDFDLLVGGFPCQSFSIAGKRGGFSDTRGTLFFDIARILQEKKPRLLLLENVKGLLSHNNGRTFATIIQTLDELGYDLQWQVLNSKNHGVPQNRERVFIVGHLRGTCRPEVFPFGSGDTEIDDKSEIAADRQGISNKGSESDNRSVSRRTSHTVRSSGRASGIDKKQNWDTYEIGGSIRRLTPIECERLQGFPDNWTIGSDTQRYKQCGNAVTVNVIQAIMERLLVTPLEEK